VEQGVGHFPGSAKDIEGRVYQIGVSPFDAGAAYIAIDRHQLDDRRPYVFKTSDYGKTWTDIGRGLPADVPARVVRENPNSEASWFWNRRGAVVLARRRHELEPLKAEFPTAPVYDVQFIKRSHDLLIATHGRGLFVMDNITPLEELTPDVVASDLHVFSTLPAQIRVRRGARASPRRASPRRTRRRRGDRLLPQGCRRHRLIRFVGRGKSGGAPAAGA